MGIWDIYAVDLSCLDHRHVLRMRQLLALDPSVFGPTMTARKSPKKKKHEKMMGKYGFIAGKSTIYNEENDGKTWDIHYEWRFIAGKILCRCVSGQLGVWYKLDAPGRWLTNLLNTNSNTQDLCKFMGYVVSKHGSLGISPVFLAIYPIKDH